MSSGAPNFGSKNYDAGGVSIEQTNGILEEDPADEDAQPFRRRQTRTLCPEHRLLMALLETALHLVVTTPAHRRRTSTPWQEAHDWIFSDEVHIFSFRYALEYLDLDVSLPQIRRGIQWKLAANDRRPLLVQSRSAERKRMASDKPLGELKKERFYRNKSKAEAPFVPLEAEPADGGFKQDSTL